MGTASCPNLQVGVERAPAADCLLPYAFCAQVPAPMTGAVNPSRLYYNFGGRWPPVPWEATPALPPTNQKLPKLITDTTLRDGAQDSRFALFPHEAKLRYYDLLHQLDNGCGVIDNTEVFIYQRRDLWVLDQLLAREYSFPRITTWTRATPKDIRDLVEVSQGRIRETGILASASDHHIFDKLAFRSKEEAIEKYLRPVMTALEHGITPRVHLEDTTKADIGGWVLPFMHRVLQETAGQAKFRLCDTIGWGVPDPRAGLPVGIPHLVATLYRETGAELEFHGHNDFGLATANALAAWTYGCRAVNTTFGGLGERTGNTPLEQMVALYVRAYGDPGFDLHALADIRRLLDAEVVPTSPKQPIIGDVFSTQAGIHQQGVARQHASEGGLIYLAYEPSLVGRDSEELDLIGALSGMEGIVAVLNGEMEKTTGQPGRFTTASRVVKQIYDCIQAAYDGEYEPETDRFVGCRRTFFSPAELAALAASLGDSGP